MQSHGNGAVIPSYLRGYESIYQTSPRDAARRWFAEARFGLFLHYGLYSILARGEWVLKDEAIPLEEYDALKQRFTADRFDANAICDLAQAANMKYVTITTRHHDSFCLFRTAQSDHNSVQSPAGRDLVGELADACRARGLGLFLYYSYGLDWRHPYFMSVQEGAKFCWHPKQTEQPSYRFKSDDDMQHYVQFVHAQLQELLTQYGPVAGIWFDPIVPFYSRPDLFPIEQTYRLIRSLQPQTLISYKQGATGDEDYAAPEHSAHSMESRLRNMGLGEVSIETARRAWEINQHKHNEICTTMHPKWGCIDAPDDKHIDPPEVLEKLAVARGRNCNLLLNTGPLANGSIHTKDAATLRAVGEQIRAKGWPTATEVAPQSDHSSKPTLA